MQLLLILVFTVIISNFTNNPTAPKCLQRLSSPVLEVTASEDCEPLGGAYFRNKIEPTIIVPLPEVPFNIPWQPLPDRVLPLPERTHLLYPGSFTVYEINKGNLI